jgi:predicted 3-demethylubiquinone-9 3-methyltransferase (glyoxalase superfamily)
MQKITPFLWFNNQAEEAVNLYVSLFENSKIVKVTRYDDAAANASGRPKGSVMTIAFQLRGQDFTALNGGPHFKFTEAVSFIVNCDTQAEIDKFWSKLSEDGEPGQCGWLKDRFGLSWQVIPATLGEMIKDKDPAKSRRVMTALLQMRKVDIQALERARDQR